MRYDLHIHTCYSACSNLQPKDLVRIAKLKGLDGIAVTDHNSIAGAILAKKLNKDKHFEVIVGEEVDTDFGHVLAYYLNGRIAKGSLSQVIDDAKSQGAILALAHPLDFLRHFFPKDTIRTISNRIDALEVFNSRSVLPYFNSGAARIAECLNLANIAGSDAHFSYEIGGASTIFEGDLISAIRKRKTTVKGTIFCAPIGHFQTFLHKNIGIL